MAFDIRSIAKAREYAEAAKKKMAKVREHAEEAIGYGIQAVEVSGTSFAMGYANARWGKEGELKIAGLPVDLGAAVALHGVAFMGGLGKYSEHGHNVADGAMAAYSYRMGAQLGVAALKSASTPQQKTSGLPFQGPAYEMASGDGLNGVRAGKNYTVLEDA